MRYLIISNIKKTYEEYKPFQSTIPAKVKNGMTELFPKEDYIHREGSCWICLSLDDKNFTQNDLKRVQNLISEYDEISVSLYDELPSNSTCLVFIEHASSMWMKQRNQIKRSQQGGENPKQAIAI